MIEDKFILTVKTLGRIKTSFIKNIAEELMKSYGNQFTTDFRKNKEMVKQLIDIKSKKIRNMVAGYVTKLKKIESPLT